MSADKKVDAVCKRVAALLQEERERQKLSMTVLAERAGLSQPSVSYIERSMRVPSLDTLLRIANVLGIDLGALIQQATQSAKSTGRGQLPVQ